jgi:hypothetical protein
MSIYTEIKNQSPIVGYAFFLKRKPDSEGYYKELWLEQVKRNKERI